MNGWKIYVNGVQADDADSESGTYTGTTDNGLFFTLTMRDLQGVIMQRHVK